MAVDTESKGIRYRGTMEWAQSFSDDSFRCPAGCHACCRRSIGPGLTGRDCERISRQAGRSSFADKRDHPIFPYRLKTIDGHCLFLGDAGRCRIYPFRPLLCRLYPLQLHFQWDGKLLWCLEHCPGVGVEDGIPFDGAYLEGLLVELLEKEDDAFLENLRGYVLKTKNFLTPLFQSGSGLVYSNWVIKGKLKKIVWAMFEAKALTPFTPRGRLECVLYDLLPAFEEILMRNARHLPGEKKYYLDQVTLSDAFKQYQPYFEEWAHESAARESIHIEELERNGIIAYRAERGGTLRCPQQSNIIVRGFDHRKVEMNAGKLICIASLTPEASRIEETYLQELQRREGRFGTVVTDLTIDSEVTLMFMAADALELKANAFAAEKGKKAIELEEIREGIWLVEKQLSGLLELVQKSVPFKQSGDII